MSKLASTTTHMQRPSPHWGQHRSLAVLALLAAVGFLLLLFSRQGKEYRPVLQLPEADRAVLYQHTVDNLQRVCSKNSRPDGLEEFCKQQAEFVLMFPECDAGCQYLAKTHRGQPTR